MGVIHDLVDAAPVGDHVVDVLDPGADLRSIRGTFSGACSGAAGGLAADGRVGARHLGVVCGEINFVVRAVQGEGDGVLGGTNLRGRPPK